MKVGGEIYVNQLSGNRTRDFDTADTEAYLVLSHFIIVISLYLCKIYVNVLFLCLSKPSS